MELVSCRFRRHWSLLAKRRFRPSVPWWFAVSESPARTSLLFRNRPLELRCGAVLRAWELQFGAGFLSVQKATLGTGACLLGAASVLQCHGVLLFRNRPLELRSGAVLRAWELHFGASLLSVQKATLGTGACLLLRLLNLFIFTSGT